MRQLILNIKDDSKFDILMNLLKEISFVEVKEETSQQVKKWKGIPDAVINPITVGNFKMYSREELYDR